MVVNTKFEGVKDFEFFSNNMKDSKSTTLISVTPLFENTDIEKLISYLHSGETQKAEREIRKMMDHYRDVIFDIFFPSIPSIQILKKLAQFNIGRENPDTLLHQVLKLGEEITTEILSCYLKERGIENSIVNSHYVKIN